MFEAVLNLEINYTLCGSISLALTRPGIRKLGLRSHIRAVTLFHPAQITKYIVNSEIIPSADARDGSEGC